MNFSANCTEPNDTVSKVSDTVFPVEATWNWIAVLQVLITTATIILNGFLLFLLKDWHSLTAFTVYLVALCSSNIVYAALNGPFDVLVALYKNWQFGSEACTLFIYGGMVVSSITMFCHCLITSNRMWAIFGPLSYRNYHSKKVAIIICVSISVSTHIFIGEFLNLVLLDAAPRLPNIFCFPGHPEAAARYKRTICADFMRRACRTAN